MDLSIIIVSYNSAKFIESCIDSIINSGCLFNREIIIVDNFSADVTANIVRFKYPEVRLIQNCTNIGFARANNQGAKIARGRYILFLNPDTVVQENAFQRMINFMEQKPNAGILGPKLLYPDGSLQFSCRHFYNLRAILLRRTVIGKIFSNNKLLHYHLMSNWDHNQIREVDWVLGACLMVRREVLEEVGYFDDKYKIYFEDVDLCYRVKKAGYKIFYYPEAIVIHHHQRESAKKFSIKTIWHIQSAIRFSNKFGWKF